MEKKRKNSRSECSAGKRPINLENSQAGRWRRDECRAHCESPYVAPSPAQLSLHAHHLHQPSAASPETSLRVEDSNRAFSSSLRRRLLLLHCLRPPRIDKYNHQQTNATRVIERQKNSLLFLSIFLSFFLSFFPSSF